MTTAIQLTIDFSIPDVQSPDFYDQASIAWQRCNDLSVRSLIVQGVILRRLRDRDENNGVSNFNAWCARHELTPARAQKLMEAAKQADILFEEGLEPKNIDRFTEKGFWAAIQAEPPVRAMLVAVANEAEQSLTKGTVRETDNEWLATSREWLSEDARTLIPAKYLADLVRRVEALPEGVQGVFEEQAASTVTGQDEAKLLAREAQATAKIYEKMEILLAQPDGCDVKALLSEVQAAELTTSLAQIIGWATDIENLAIRLWTKVTSLDKGLDRISSEVGAGTPQLKALIEKIMDDLGDRQGMSVPVLRSEVRVKISVDSERLTPRS